MATGRHLFDPSGPARLEPDQRLVSVPKHPAARLLRPLAPRSLCFQLVVRYSPFKIRLNPPIPAPRVNRVSLCVSHPPLALAPRPFFGGFESYSGSRFMPNPAGSRGGGSFCAIPSTSVSITIPRRCTSATLSLSRKPGTLGSPHGAGPRIGRSTRAG